MTFLGIDLILWNWLLILTNGSLAIGILTYKGKLKKKKENDTML